MCFLTTSNITEHILIKSMKAVIYGINLRRQSREVNGFLTINTPLPLLRYEVLAQILLIRL